MARMMFNKMTVKELTAAQAEIASLLEVKKQEEREALKAKLASLASAEGFSVQELFGNKSGSARKGGTVAPKYRNPENGHQVWSGRGRQPLWFVSALKKGVKPEKLLIK